MKKILYAVAIYFLILISNKVFAQWEPMNNGLYGGITTSISIDNDNILVGTIGGGVFLSTDNGNNWEQKSSGLPDLFVNAVLISGKNIFAGTQDSGIFISTDYGNTWKEKNSGLYYSGIPSIYALAEIGNVLFAGTEKGLFFSTDNGDIWSKTDVKYVFVKDIVVSEGKIFVAGGWGGLLRFSTDNGQSWQRIDCPEGLNTYIESVAIKGNDIIIGTIGEGIFISTDWGKSWSKKGENVKNLKYVPTLAVIGDSIWAGSWSWASSDSLYRGGLYLSTDDGNSWIQKDSNLIDVSVIANSDDNERIFVCTAGGGTFLSTDKGDIWVEKNSNLTSAVVYSLAASKENICAGTRNGLYISSIDGANWINKTPELTIPVIPIVAIDPANDKDIFIYQDLDIFKSTDNGDSWTKRCSRRSYYETIYCVAMNKSKMFIGSTYIAFSTDRGNTWEYIDLGKNNSIHSLFVDDNYIMAGSDDYIFISKDNGENWISSFVEGTTFSAVGKNQYALFAGDQLNGVFVSTDDGNTWLPKNSGLTNRPVLSIAIEGNNVFLGTYGGGVFVSTDNGEHWIEKNFGLMNKYINSLVISGDYIFAGTYGGGVWRAKLSDLTTDVKDSPAPSDAISLFPNPATDNNLNINLSDNTQSIQSIEIYDQLGRLNIYKSYELSESSGSRSISVGALPPSVYFVKITTQNSIIYKKFIKM